jgi:hypothetical protein
MKKVLFTMMAIAAIGFTSCGNKTQQGEATDSTEVAFNIDDEANATIAALTEQIEAGDVTKLQRALETVKEKIAEFIKTNPEVAKEYVAKVQTFLKENAEKIKSVVGDNATVAAAVSALADVEPENVVSGLLQSVGDAASEAKDSAVSAAKEKAGEAVDAAADKTKKALGL